MKMYTCNGGYFRTQEEAKAASKTSGNPFAPVDVPTDAKGLVAYLNSVAGRRFNEAAEGAQAAPAAPEQANGVDPAFSLEDAFNAAPLGMQLTLASIATENAYQHLAKTSPIPLAPQGYGGSIPRVAEVADDLL